MRHVAIAVALTSVVACSGEQSRAVDASPRAADLSTRVVPDLSTPDTELTVTPVAADSKTFGAPFESFDRLALLHRLQGAWTGVAWGYGELDAWDIKGGTATVFDGKTTSVRDFVLYSPCSFRIIERSAHKTTWTPHFAFEGALLHAGLGGVAIRKGTEVVFCSAQSTYHLKDGKCESIKHDILDDNKLKITPAQCSLAGDEFRCNDRGYDTKLVFKGDTAISQEMSETKSKKFPSLAAAKKSMPPRP